MRRHQSDLREDRAATSPSSSPDLSRAASSYTVDERRAEPVADSSSARPLPEPHRDVVEEIWTAAQDTP
eukprot:4606786-Prymnesium_polylepis.1